MTRERSHGAALVLLAVAVPIGEGVGVFATAALALATVARRRELELAPCVAGVAGRTLLAFGVWLAAGLVAVALGHEGLHRASELGILVPLLALPLVLIAVRALPPRWLALATAAFVLTLAVACVFALLQFAFNVRPGESIARVASTVASQGRIPGDFERTAAGGFYFHRLKMAHVLLLGIGVLWSRQLFGALSARRRVAELVLLGLYACTLMFTYTRGALLAAAVAMVATLVFAPRRYKVAGLGLAVVAGILMLSIPSVRGRLASIGGSEAKAVRALIWSQGVRIIADHPLGVGLSNYPAVVNRYYDAEDPHFDIRTYPHNILFAAWAEAGPIGLVAYAMAWLQVILGCIAALWRRGGDRALRVTAGAGLFGVTALFVVGLTHDVLFHKPVALAFSLLVGATLARLATEPEEG
ncbi:MAG: O-antigen ligase family protein [Deltaproteobacteria bacterium]|nr:O-antigen ligase family protein [Deltaproteobacteria bacterium]